MAAASNKACLNIPWPRDPPVVQSKIMLWEPCDIHAQDAANARQRHFLDLRALCLAHPNRTLQMWFLQVDGFRRLRTMACEGDPSFPARYPCCSEPTGCCLKAMPCEGDCSIPW